MDFSASKQLGKEGESWASRFAEQVLGWALVERNAHFRCGEIDLIFLDRGELVFVEVKTRRCDRYGSALESLSLSKIVRFKKACLEWLSRQSEWRAFRMECFAVQIKGSEWTMDRFTIE